MEQVHNPMATYMEIPIAKPPPWLMATNGNSPDLPKYSISNLLGHGNHQAENGNQTAAPSLKLDKAVPSTHHTVETSYKKYIGWPSIECDQMQQHNSTSIQPHMTPPTTSCSHSRVPPPAIDLDTLLTDIKQFCNNPMQETLLPMMYIFCQQPSSITHPLKPLYLWHVLILMCSKTASSPGLQDYPNPPTLNLRKTWPLQHSQQWWCQWCYHQWQCHCQQHQWHPASHQPQSTTQQWITLNPKPQKISQHHYPPPFPQQCTTCQCWQDPP